MTKPVMNEVNIVSKGRSVIVDVNDNGSVNKHGGASPKQNKEISLVTVSQKLDTVLIRPISKLNWHRKQTRLIMMHWKLEFMYWSVRMRSSLGWMGHVWILKGMDLL